MLWAAEDCKRLAAFACGHLEALGLSWSPAAALLAGGSHGGALNFFSVAEGEAEGAFTLGAAGSVACGGGGGGGVSAAAAIMCTAFSGDGSRCAAGHADGRVSVVDVAARALLLRLPAGGAALPLRSLAFWGGGAGGAQQRLVTGGDDARVTLRWLGGGGGAEGEGEEGEGGGGGGGGGEGGGASQLAVLASHIGFVTGVAAGPPGCPFLASASADKTALLWDTRRRAPVAVLEGAHSDKVNGVALCPQGRLLASVSEGGGLVLSKLPAWP